LHGLAASYTRIEEYYRGKAMAEMALPDIDLEGRVVIMTGADRGLGRGNLHAGIWSQVLQSHLCRDARRDAVLRPREDYAAAVSRCAALLTRDIIVAALR
jgi:hypothetical protein